MLKDIAIILAMITYLIFWEEHNHLFTSCSINLRLSLVDSAIRETRAYLIRHQSGIFVIKFHELGEIHVIFLRVLNYLYAVALYHTVCIQHLFIIFHKSWTSVLCIKHQTLCLLKY